MVMSSTVGRNFAVRSSYRYADADYLVLKEVPDILRAMKPYTVDFLDDLLGSEMAYKKNLDLLMEVYIKPLHKLAASTKDVPTHKELEGWFPEITSMVILSGEFIRSLESVLAPVPHIETLLDERLLAVLNYQVKRFSYLLFLLRFLGDD